MFPINKRQAWIKRHSRLSKRFLNCNVPVKTTLRNFYTFIKNIFFLSYYIIFYKPLSQRNFFSFNVWSNIHLAKRIYPLAFLSSKGQDKVGRPLEWPNNFFPPEERNINLWLRWALPSWGSGWSRCRSTCTCTGIPPSSLSPLSLPSRRRKWLRRSKIAPRFHLEWSSNKFSKGSFLTVTLNRFNLIPFDLLNCFYLDKMIRLCSRINFNNLSTFLYSSIIFFWNIVSLLSCVSVNFILIRIKIVFM